MAQMSTDTTACFIWKLKDPCGGGTRKSCYFSFLATQFWLEVGYEYDKNTQHGCYTISLNHRGDVSEKEVHNATIILELEEKEITTGSVAYLMCDVDFKAYHEQTLWKLPQQYLTEKNSDFLNGHWKITCVFKTRNVKVDSSTRVEDDYSKLRLLYPDAKLRCGDRTVSVHRSVLAARSPVFKSMFVNSKSDTTFDVPELDDKTVDPFLWYAYSGKFPGLYSKDVAVGLYRAGYKYKMRTLRKACSDWMMVNLPPGEYASVLDAENVSGGDLPFVITRLTTWRLWE